MYTYVNVRGVRANVLLIVDIATSPQRPSTVAQQSLQCFTQHFLHNTTQHSSFTSVQQ